MTNSSMATAAGRIVRSPGVKFFTLGFLTLLLLIPAAFIWMLVAEREQRAERVAFDIARTWGGEQRLVGPFLVVPYEVEETRLVDDTPTVVTVQHEAVFLPETLSVDAAPQTEIRTRGIFDVTVYTSTISLNGRFARPDQRLLAGPQATFRWDEARLALGISAVRAIRNAVVLTMNGSERSFEPSLGLDLRSGGHEIAREGIHVPSLFTAAPTAFDFSIELELAGSGSLMVTPSARDTSVQLSSDWPHPSFIGATLPQASEISEEGFEANWQVPHLSRSVPLAFNLGSGQPLNQLAGDAFGVRFFQPVDFYASVDRALKYAILFIGIVFISVFVIEMRSEKSVHVVQYVFVGLALVLFYVLLLSLAEHLGFLIAYLIAASATAGLIGTYCARSLESAKQGGLVGAMIVSVFGVLYLFLRLEDYALLAGSLFAFAVLTITMFATQNIDWSGLKLPGDKQNPSNPPANEQTPLTQP